MVCASLLFLPLCAINISIHIKIYTEIFSLCVYLSWNYNNIQVLYYNSAPIQRYKRTHSCYHFCFFLLFFFKKKRRNNDIVSVTFDVTDHNAHDATMHSLLQQKIHTHTHTEREREREKSSVQDLLSHISKGISKKMGSERSGKINLLRAFYFSLVFFIHWWWWWRCWSWCYCHFHHTITGSKYLLIRLNRRQTKHISLKKWM